MNAGAAATQNSRKTKKKKKKRPKLAGAARGAAAPRARGPEGGASLNSGPLCTLFHRLPLAIENSRARIVSWPRARPRGARAANPRTGGARGAPARARADARACAYHHRDGISIISSFPRYFLGRARTAPPARAKLCAAEGGAKLCAAEGGVKLYTAEGGVKLYTAGCGVKERAQCAGTHACTPAHTRSAGHISV